MWYMYIFLFILSYIKHINIVYIFCLYLTTTKKKHLTICPRNHSLSVHVYLPDFISAASSPYMVWMYQSWCLHFLCLRISAVSNILQLQTMLQWITSCTFIFVLLEVYLQGKFTDKEFFFFGGKDQEVNTYVSIVWFEITKFPFTRAVKICISMVYFRSSCFPTAWPRKCQTS